MQAALRRIAPVALCSLAVVALLTGLRAALGEPVGPATVPALWLGLTTVLAGGLWAPPVVLLGAAAVAGGAFIATGFTWAAWALVAALWALLLAAEGLLEHRGRFVRRWLARLATAALLAGVPVALAQLESHFAEEEFFVAVQAAIIGVLALFVVLTFRLLVGRERGEADAAAAVRPGLASARRALVVAAVLGVGALALAVVTVRGYQASFYPPAAPMYAGVSAEEPFLCGTVTPEPGTVDGATVFEALIAAVADNPHKAAPEYGMLALASGDAQWASEFRGALLADARVGRYTEPANSVKIGQYDGSLRVYYYARVRERFPGLFTPDEEVEVRRWLAAVNRRTLTVEWVDLMYGLAFSMRPEGPYENQENGAGLIALLEATGLAPVDLHAANVDYLRRNPRGWQQRFRNTDDAIGYQPSWINNAYFQSLYAGAVDATRQRRSFEWLLLQSLPDGGCLTYDHPICYSIAKTAYLGAELTGDSELLWFAARALEGAAVQGSTIGAQPGVEAPIALVGVSPTEGSCLIYGDSGLPNHVGPLAPDKIVFRDGWAPDARYLMLNLRFSGWHRYKATNTLTLLYQQGMLAADSLGRADYKWLPRGRSLFRDKRIPRENLNGLLVPRTGLSAVVYTLSGIGGAWAQDPPAYATVERFEALGQLDVSRTTIADWRGWRHSRTVLFLDDGPAIVLDNASGDGRAALAWHAAGAGEREGSGLWLRRDDTPSRLVWPEAAWPAIGIETDAVPRDGQPSAHALYAPATTGVLSLATAWLTGDWATGEARVEPVASSPGAYLVTAQSAGGEVAVLAGNGGRVAVGGLATDGDAVVVRRSGDSATVCVVGGTEHVVPLEGAPASVEVQGGAATPAWEWREGSLILHNAGVSACVDVR